MPWAKTGAIQYHAQLKFLEKGCASQSVGCLKGDWMLDIVIISIVLCGPRNQYTSKQSDN